MSSDTATPSKLSRYALWGGVALIAVIAIAVVAAVIFTARPAFLGGYHTYERGHDTLTESSHQGMRCEQCHRPERGPVLHRVALVGDFYRGLVARPDEPVFATLGPPTKEACLSCHEQDWSDDSARTSNVPHPAHLRVADEERDCIECHKWTAHEEAYIEEHKEMPFSTVCASFGCHVGTKTADECGSCHHDLKEGEGEWRAVHKDTVRAEGPNACLEMCHDADECRLCHTTGKRPDFPEGGASAAVKTIEREHVKDDWLEKHGPLALEDEDKCFLCHVSVGECEDCHSIRPDFHGLESTWLNRHKEFAEDNEERCLTCHDQPWCDECHDQFKEMR